MDSPLLKYSAKDYFFKAALCHFCIDMLNAKVSPPRAYPPSRWPLGTGATVTRPSPPQLLTRGEPLTPVWPLTIGLGREALVLTDVTCPPLSGSFRFLAHLVPGLPLVRAHLIQWCSHLVLPMRSASLSPISQVNTQAETRVSCPRPHG